MDRCPPGVSERRYFFDCYRPKFRRSKPSFIFPNAAICSAKAETGFRVVKPSVDDWLGV